MTNRQLLKKLEQGLKYDEILDDEAELWDILDNLAEIGVPDAAILFQIYVKSQQPVDAKPLIKKFAAK